MIVGKHIAVTAGVFGSFHCPAASAHTLIIIIAILRDESPRPPLTTHHPLCFFTALAAESYVNIFHI